MKLDETIKHYEEAAEKQENNAKTYPKPQKNVKGSGKKYNARIRCAKEYRQLAEWLRELKAYREILANADNIIASEYGCVIIEGYRDVIDRMNEVFKEMNADEKL
jgi:hypothetical protein